MTDPGQIIFLGYKDTYASCARCHGKQGQGGRQAPDIRHALQKYGRQEIRRYILFGKGKDDDRMPGFATELTPVEIDQVLDFLTTLDKQDSLKTPASKNAPMPTGEN